MVDHEYVTCVNYSMSALYASQCVNVLVAQLRPILCDLMDCSRQASLSMGCSRQEYWSRLLFPSPGDLPNPRMEPGSPTLQGDSLPSKPPGKPYIFSHFKKLLLLF